MIKILRTPPLSVMLLHGLLLVSPMIARPAVGQAAAPALFQPDDRYKADVLLVIAHPDDDTQIGGYLARLTLDERKRIAVVYTTNGDGGGNQVGNEAGAALGQMRILEARRSLGAWGIDNVWFLNWHDTPGQNVLWSLDRWNHGLGLDEMVRLVRITRPEVIFTWLPIVDAGEDHDDHQASGVLATEAFDSAGDPTVFPEQVSSARSYLSNLTEGLLPWQPKKIYYFTDAYEDFTSYWHEPAVLSPFRKNIVDGHGPHYDTTTISPSRHVSYAQLAAVQAAFYQTQEGNIGARAVKSGDYKEFEYPVYLILGKSLVGGTTTGDVFEGVSTHPLPFVRASGYKPEKLTGLQLTIGDPWRFYTRFWKAHDLDHLAELIPVPELAAQFGEKLRIPLEACNYTSDAAVMDIKATLPAGWTDETKFTRYPVRAGECYPVLTHLKAYEKNVPAWQELKWTATAGANAVGSVNMRIFLEPFESLPE